MSRKTRTWTAAEVDALSPDRARALRDETKRTLTRRDLTNEERRGARAFMALLDRRIAALDVPTALRVKEARQALGLDPKPSAGHEAKMKAARSLLYNDADARDGRVRRG